MRDEAIPECSELDLGLLERIVQAEADAEPYEGKVAVAAVVINRVLHPMFPGTIHEVITQHHQFSAYHPLGTIWRFNVTDETRRAVQDALRGVDPSGGSHHYYAYKLIPPPSWTRALKETVTIGDHRFYRLWDHSLSCSLCGKTCRGPLGLSQHRAKAHPGIAHEKIVDYYRDRIGGCYDRHRGAHSDKGSSGFPSAGDPVRAETDSQAGDHRGQRRENPEDIGSPGTAPASS